MLPAPVFSKTAHGSISLRLVTLRQRSRVTNLAVLILLASLAISLLLNLRLWFGIGVASTPITSVAHEAGYQRHPDSILSTISGRVYAKNLIVVAGHAIWKGCLPERRLDDSDWILAEYQKGSRSITAFFSHIVKGAEVALADKQSLLVFSGGQTRGTWTTSEGESYSRLAIESNVFHNGFMPFERATSEEHSLDSYQNLLFSIARFHEVTGSYPEHITVIGFEMKRRRFEQLHIRALRWPATRFTYIGIDEEGDTTLQYQGEVSYNRQWRRSFLLTTICFPGRKWLFTLLAGPVWLSWRVIREAPTPEFLLSFPSAMVAERLFTLENYPGITSNCEHDELEASTRVLRMPWPTSEFERGIPILLDSSNFSVTRNILRAWRAFTLPSASQVVVNQEVMASFIS